MVKQAVLFLAGGYDLSRKQFYRDLVSSDSGELLIVAVDGGADALAQLGIKPGLWIGDGDSTSQALPTGKDGCEVICLPREKDQSDAEAALQLLMERGYRDVIMTGSMSLDNQLDHQLGHVLLLERMQRRFGLLPHQLSIVNPNSAVLVVCDGTLNIEAHFGAGVSVAVLSENARLSYEGLRYPLINDVIERGETRSLRNEMSEAQASISVKGTAAVFLHDPSATGLEMRSFIRPR